MSNNRVQIAPSVLASDLSRLTEEIKALEEAGIDVFHLDIMDGHFVPNITFGFPIIEKIRPLTEVPFDAHLMIENPEKYIDDFHRAGCNWVSIHLEACSHIHSTLSQIKKWNMKAGIAINPETPLSSLEGVIDDVDYILVMGVNPGFSGQKFISGTFERVQELRKNLGNRNVKIEIDGGITESNIKQAVDAGAEIIVMGTGLLEAEDYKKKVAAIRKAITA